MMVPLTIVVPAPANIKALAELPVPPFATLVLMVSVLPELILIVTPVMFQEVDSNVAIVTLDDSVIVILLVLMIAISVVPVLPG